MITLYLRGQVRGSREELEAFLRRARPVYEAPGGISVRLQWDLDRPGDFVEIVEYADRQAYDADQVRIGQDAQMRALLDEWRSLLVGPVTVTAMEEAAL